MLRRITAIGIGMVLSSGAMAWAPSTQTAPMRVSLVIVDSCLVRSDDPPVRKADTQPGVACVHDAPYRMTFADPASGQAFGLGKASPQTAQPMTWQVIF